MSEMTLDRLRKLRRVAEAATPGPWWVDGWEARTKDGDRFIASIKPAFQGASPDASCWEVDANIQHIAAFDPTTALALLDEIERLRRERDNWKRVAEQKTEALCDVAEERIRLRTEREVLAEAVRAMEYFFDSDYSDPEESATLNWSYAYQKWSEALDLLDGEIAR